jgi:hypothetical protein
VETYTVELHCTNCGQTKEYEIEKGTRVRRVACDNCDVLALTKDFYRYKKSKRGIAIYDHDEDMSE